MPVMNDIIENIKIERIAKNFLSAPHKVNKIHEADAELIDIGEKSDKYLALTTDALIEEISSGLYDDPYLIGWMLAMVNFSDLAAVGADPLGLLITVNYSSRQSEEYIAKIAEGISHACQRLNTYVLGGDSNEGKDFFLSGCAAGLVSKESILTRIGAKPGDRLYLSGQAGLGSIYAFLRLTGQYSETPESFYQPVARIKEGQIIRQFASCCMDTSDGVIHTADTLMRLNQCQFVLDENWEHILHPIAVQVCKAQNIPMWLSLAAVHGEFELFFSINPINEKAFLKEASEIGWSPILLGEVKEGEGVSVRTKGKLISIDTTAIRNLYDKTGSDPNQYINALLGMAAAVGV